MKILVSKGRRSVDSFYVEDLEQLLLGGKKHDTGNAYKIFPFNTRTAYHTISKSFDNIFGNFILQMSGNKFKKLPDLNYEYETEDQVHLLSKFIANEFFKTQEGTTDEEFEFTKMVDSLLYTNNRFTPVHPYLFNLINFDQTIDQNFKAYGLFLANCFGEGTDFKNVFNEKNTNNILIKSILNNASKLIEQDSREHTKEFKSVLPFFTKLYIEDVNFLQQNKERFFKDVSLLTHYYFFMYIGQFIYKSEAYTQADLEKATPLHFVLDHEKLSKRRKESMLLQSFEEVEHRANYLFSHINVLSQLSYNVVQKGVLEHGERNEVLFYGEIKQNLELEQSEFIQDFIEKVQTWLVKYQEWKKIDQQELSTDFDELMRIYVRIVQKGLHKDAIAKVSSAFKHIGKPQFIKSRGSLGNTFNLKHEVLILLTSVIVKDERMPLKQVFEQLELRGILLDQYSKQEVINIYNSHNILDKKSDSGDAQYVKRIL